jgi:hypothetical protein
VPPDKSPFWIANAGLFLMYNELRLLIRHPSMGRLSPSPAFFAESLSICAEASRNILLTINRFRDFRQLECHPQVRPSPLFLTNQSVSTIILASLTILYSLWEKKNETTKQEIEKEMQMPLDILAEIGQTYGPTRKLHQALATLVAATIENLERSRNGAKIQGVSFGSPTPNLLPRPMQLPMRIDPSLQFDRAIPGRGHAQPIMPLPVPGNLGWQDPVHGEGALQGENQGFLNGVRNGNVVETSTSDGFDDPMLWGPSLEWTGGWDDFLNAIAM